MTGKPRIHLTVIFEDSELPEIAASRRRWDPAMAGGVPPHVTLVYPEEFTEEGLLVDRAADAAARFGPFSLHVGKVTDVVDEGGGGVFCAAVDPTKSWSGLRELLLKPPFTRLEVSPHITVVHPRTSPRWPEAFVALTSSELDCQLVVREFCLTSTDQMSGMSVRRRFRLTGGSRQLCVAVVLVDGDRGLLARRSADRDWYPGVWDMVGGRVEVGESLIFAACREINEELGIDVDGKDLGHVETIVTDDAEVVVFAAERWTGAPQNAAPDEHDEIGWFDPVSLAEVETSHPSLPDLVSLACSMVLKRVLPERFE